MEKVLGKSLKMMCNVTGTLVNTNKTKRMAMESSIGRVEMYIKVAMLMMSVMALERCSLQMAQSTKVTGQEVYKMDRLQL
jgi:hypothetical protein